MAKVKKSYSSRKKPIEQYDHKGKKRVNNPVGLVTPETDKETGKKTYEHGGFGNGNAGYPKILLMWQGFWSRLSTQCDENHSLASRFTA